MAQDSSESRSLALLRESVKWLMASSALTAAAVVTGLQLTSLGELPLPLAIIGGVSAAVAITVALWALFAAARILTVPRPSANELCTKETNDPQLLGETRMTAPEDPVVRAVYERRTRLLGDAQSINAVYTEMLSARRALETLSHGKFADWSGRPLSPTDPTDRGYVQAAYDQAQERLEAIEDTAHYYQTYTRFDALMKRFRVGAGVFVLGIVIFAVVPAFGG